jgi:hypothetical protein
MNSERQHTKLLFLLLFLNFGLLIYMQNAVNIFVRPLKTNDNAVYVFNNRKYKLNICYWQETGFVLSAPQ